MTAHRSICVAAGKMVADNVTHLATVCTVYQASLSKYSALLPRVVLLRESRAWLPDTYVPGLTHCSPANYPIRSAVRNPSRGFERHPETDILVSALA